MTRRKTYQQGSLTFLSDEMSTFRIREFDHQTGKWKQRRFQVGKFKDKKDAQKAAQKIRAEINERNNSSPKKLLALVTFKEFIETYWKDYKMRENFQQSTLDSRNNVLKNHLLPAFGEMRLRDIKPTHVSDFINSLYREDYGAGTIRLFYTFMKSLFALAAQFDLIKKNPVRAKRHRPKVGKGKKPVLSGKQVGEIIRHLPNANEKMMAAHPRLNRNAPRRGAGFALDGFQLCYGAVDHQPYALQALAQKAEDGGERGGSATGTARRFPYARPSPASDVSRAA